MLGRNRCVGWVKVLAGSAVLGLAVAAQGADAPKIGDKVQVKLGENWVEATVTDVEGQRVRGKVAAGIESWFGPGDYKVGAAAGGPKTDPAKGGGAPATATEAPKPAVPPRPARIVVGQKVETAFAGTWLEATVLARDGDRTKVKLKSGMELWQTPDKVRVIVPPDANFIASLKVGSELLVDDNGTWRKSKVLAKEGNRVKIHYEGWADTWDTWVGPDRVRPIGTSLAGGAGGGGDTAGGGGAASTPVEPEPSDVPRGDLASVRELQAEKETVSWAVKPDPEGEPAQKPATGPLPLGVKVGERETVDQIFFTPAPLPTATVVLVEPEHFREPGRTRVVKLPLANAKAPERAELPGGARLMDVSPDATRVITRQKVSELPNVLQVATFAGKLTPVVTWKPYREEGEVTMAAFVDGKHVLTCSKEGVAILWQLPEGSAGQPKGIYSLKMGNQVKPVLSPGRKVLAGEAHGGLRFFEALTGAPLGGVDDLGGAGSLSFRQDGAQVAFTTANRMTLVDVNSGQAMREIPLLPEFTSGVMPGWGGFSAYGMASEFLPGGYVMLGRRWLVAPSQRMVIWDYRLPLAGPAEAFAGLSYYVAPLRDGTGGVGLYSTKLPHEAAAKSISASNVRLEDLLVLRPGVNVTLDVSTDAPGDLRQKITESLTKQLEGMGVKLGGGGNVRVSARTEAGETKTMTYRVFGRGQETVSAQEKIHKVTVEQDGKVMWKWETRAAPPFMVSAKQGQALSDAVRADMERSYTWFTTVKIPKDVVRPDLYKVQGASAVGANGVEAVKEKS